MGERTDDMYLFDPVPPGDCVGQGGTGECNLGRIIPVLPDGDGLESGI